MRDIIFYRVHGGANGRVRLLCEYLEVWDQQYGNVDNHRAGSLFA